ncbi:glycosyltransferase [Candidatus Berkiella aquae]|uniref:Glycosyltransferase family 4 protein n=1 Tax=Candidatus Berkiella aquae TaxID=295108 RepID=A0A0Q9YW64_9GAMM|nr:glycosyltransferase family 4 protein [Candidatus Berkiella aquae]MCS5712289.1 glycosyltransferase family 4 protein [Candidatus Berkiella aquae]
MKTVDIVFVTHLPAFYKVNLYNELAKHCRLFVIFIASASNIRTKDFTPSDFAFDYCMINEGAFEERMKLKSLAQLYRQLKALDYQQIIVGGWDLWEFWLIAMLFPKKRNALALESSIFESKTQGLAGSIKRFFLSRIERVYCSGDAQRHLLQALSFNKEIKQTLGVGIFHYAVKKASIAKTFHGKFLYVGRLSPEKNLENLVQFFAEFPQYQLTLVGQGPLQRKLEALAGKNVILAGHVPNQDLAEYYQSHDMFILPSLKEPWGLVVEEALYYGLPVIASNQVGAAKDFITRYQAGRLFEPKSLQSFAEALTWCIAHYAMLLANVAAIDFKARDEWQVKQYLETVTL